MHNFVYFTMKRRKKQDKLKNALGNWAKTEKAQSRAILPVKKRVFPLVRFRKLWYNPEKGGLSE